MQSYVDQKLVGGWTPPSASSLPDHFRTTQYVGAAVLYLVAISHDGTPAPRSWSDLTSPHQAVVALPDPSFAASALAALGYFSSGPRLRIAVLRHVA